MDPEDGLSAGGGFESGGSIESSMESTLADITSRGSGSSGGGNASNSASQSGGSGPATQGAGSPPPAAGAPGETPPAGAGVTQAAWDKMPTSWKREMEAKWSGLDPDVRKYVHEREAQAFDGIRQYSEQLAPWREAMKPYEQHFQQFKLNPQEVFKSLANAHLILKYGNAQQKAQVVQLLDRDYGLRQYFNGQGQVAPPPGADMLQQMQARLSTVEGTFQRQAEAQANQTVNSFVSDPANEYAADVIGDMIKLIEGGTASNLQDAYKIACAANPTVFEKMVQKRILAAANPPPPPPPRNLRSTGAPRVNGAATGTMEDTMRETLTKIHARG